MLSGPGAPTWRIRVWIKAGLPPAADGGSSAGPVGLVESRAALPSVHCESLGDGASPWNWMRGPELHRRPSGYEPDVLLLNYLAGINGTQGRNRTLSLRFWRPPLCRLSYLDVELKKPAWRGLRGIWRALTPQGAGRLLLSLRFSAQALSRCANCRAVNSTVQGIVANSVIPSAVW